MTKIIADNIVSHPLFIECIRAIEEAETDRIFCRHGMSHCLDAARVALLLDLKEELGFDEDLIYSACLVHDLGRARQYADGTPHDVAGAEIARKILSDCGMNENDIQLICEAIGTHRNSSVPITPFGELLQRADHLSRPCYSCQARGECHWPEEKKNKTVI